MPITGKSASARARQSPEAKLRKKAQSMTALAMKTLGDIMESEAQASVRLAAAREVLDRGHGRPKAGEPPEGGEGMTVIVRRFTDPPEAADGGQ